MGSESSRSSASQQQKSNRPSVSTHPHHNGHQPQFIVGSSSAHPRPPRQAAHRHALSQLYYTPSPPPMSAFSSAQVPDSEWSAENFLLGAGMVVFQLAEDDPRQIKVVLLWETKAQYWFLPKGRKDVGESLEQTAVREAYEESGYRVEPFPLLTQTQAPGPPSDPHAPVRANCEPIMVSTHAYPVRKRRSGGVLPAGEYLTFWYIGRIAEDAVREENTGMPDELHYQTHLFSVDDALKRIHAGERGVLRYAWWTLDSTIQAMEQQQKEMQRERRRQQAQERESERAASRGSAVDGAQAATTMKAGDRAEHSTTVSDSGASTLATSATLS